MSSPVASSSRARRTEGRQTGEQSAGAAGYPQIFVHNDGRPVRFYLEADRDYSISKYQLPLTANYVKSLARKITRHGGEICFDKEDAHVVIVNEAALEDYKYYYAYDLQIDAEQPGFISKCIADRRYVHLRPRRKPMGGVREGLKKWTTYTEREERLICKWLAIRIPYASSGGRKGNKVWQQLVEYAESFPEGEWALGTNHSWQSWREHYKKNQDRFDPDINEIVKRLPPRIYDKGLFELDRDMNRRNRVRVEQRNGEDDEEEDEEDEFVYEPRASLEPEPEPELPSRESNARETDEVEDILTIPTAKRKRIPVTPRSNQRRKATTSLTQESAPFQRQFGARPTSYRREEEEEEEEEEAMEPVEARVVADEVQPEIEDAGPSGTQNSPTQTLAPSTPGRSARTTITSTARATKRNVSRPLDINSASSDVPMSSQATLVGPVPTQLRGGEELPVTQIRGRQAEVIEIEDSPVRGETQQMRTGLRTRPRQDGPELEEIGRQPPSAPITAARKSKRSQMLLGVVVPQPSQGDAPYRNTRARARSVSVEPVQVQPTAIDRRKKTKILTEVVEGSGSEESEGGGELDHKPDGMERPSEPVEQGRFKEYMEIDEADMQLQYDTSMVSTSLADDDMDQEFEALPNTSLQQDGADALHSPDDERTHRNFFNEPQEEEDSVSVVTVEVQGIQPSSNMYGVDNPEDKHPSTNSSKHPFEESDEEEEPSYETQPSRHLSTRSDHPHASRTFSERGTEAELPIRTYSAVFSPNRSTQRPGSSTALHSQPSNPRSSLGSHTLVNSITSSSHTPNLYSRRVYSSNTPSQPANTSVMGTYARDILDQTNTDTQFRPRPGTRAHAHDVMSKARAR